MKIYKYKKVTTPILKIIFCNKCGKDISQGNYQDNYLAIDYLFGYGTMLDNQIMQCDLCEKCLIRLAKKFKLPPVMTKNEDF